MKKALSLLLVLGYALTLAPISMAQTLPVSPAAAMPHDTSRIGVAAAVNGQVKLMQKGVGTVIQSGQTIRMGDEISTGDGGRLQILLLDETVFTIGANTTMVINEFVYDPQTQDGVIKASVLKGVFRFITGKIAHKKPENMSVDLPSGTIGVRGTMVAGEVTGDRSMVVLLGPGEHNSTGQRPGAIDVSNIVNGNEVIVPVHRSGYGTEIGGVNVAPTEAFRVPQTVINQIMNQLAPADIPNNASNNDVKPAESDRKDSSGGPNGPPGSGPGSGSGGNGDDSNSGGTPPGGMNRGGSPDFRQSMRFGSDPAGGPASGSSFSMNGPNGTAMLNDPMMGAPGMTNATPGLDQIIRDGGQNLAPPPGLGTPYFGSGTMTGGGDVDILFLIDYGRGTIGGPGSTIVGEDVHGKTFLFMLNEMHVGANPSGTFTYGVANGNVTDMSADVDFALQAAVFHINSGNVTMTSITVTDSLGVNTETVTSPVNLSN